MGTTSVSVQSRATCPTGPKPNLIISHVHKGAGAGMLRRRAQTSIARILHTPAERGMHKEGVLRAQGLIGSVPSGPQPAVPKPRSMHAGMVASIDLHMPCREPHLHILAHARKRKQRPTGGTVIAHCAAFHVGTLGGVSTAVFHVGVSTAAAR